MRPLPIPVPASHAHPSAPWWMERSPTPSFAGFLRAFLPGGGTPVGFRGGTPLGIAGGSQATWLDLRILEIRWVQVSFVRQAQTATVSIGAGIPIAAPKAPPPPRDPLVVDLSGQGPQTTGAHGAQAFDLNGDGHQQPTSFVAGASAFLALDANGNGRIDSGAELFGDQHGARDGFEELRKYDANQDGIIDAKDPVFKQLKLLFGDGRLSSITESGLKAFSLEAQPDRGHTLTGDPIYRHATALTTQGGILNTYALGLNQFPPASATINPVPP